MGLVRTLFRLLKLAQTTLLVLFLVASLSLNVASVAFSSVATLMASAYGAVTGTKAVHTQLNDQIGVKNKKISSLEKSVVAKNKRIASLTDDVAKLRASQHVTYRGQKKLLSEAVEDTTGRVGRRITTNATRNVASMFGESVPVFGIAVIAVVTGWELRDACVMMKDLHELDVAFNPENATPDGYKEVCGTRVPRWSEVGAMIVDSPRRAWALTQQVMPNLADLPESKEPKIKMPDIDWTPWN